MGHAPQKEEVVKDSRSMELEKIWCAIPVFNNKATIRDVAAACRTLLSHVVVIDDGSTDADLADVLSGLDVMLLRHEKNMGKGVAILTASKYIEEQGGLYMITIDADGQHYPEDIRKFIPLISESDADIIIGCRNFDTGNVPEKSRFGRKFANFWLRVETGVEIDDCQSGFRAYPVRYLNQLQFKGLHYDFEAEILAKAVWAGMHLRPVPIDVYYPKPEERISSFRPFLDNLRLSLIHSMLVGRRLLPLRHRKLVKGDNKPDFAFLRHPGKFLMMLLKENATPGGLAMAAAVGVFFAALPLLFVHTLVILYVAARLNLNKVVAVNVQHLCMPPFVPALCIEVGYYLRHGQWLTDLSFATVFAQFSSRLFEWFLGSLIIAPAGAALVGAFIYTSALLVQKARRS
jgi:glycosyltransferase involved in cell wall biosynthesis